MDIIQIILLIAGSGGVSGFITWAVTVKAQRKKENAVADQEEVRARLDLHELENTVFDKISSRMQLIIDDQEKQISELKENQAQLIMANKLMEGKIEDLERLVQDYKDVCDTCQFRAEKKRK